MKKIAYVLSVANDKDLFPIAIYSSWTKAHDAIAENAYHVWETVYPYALIEAREMDSMYAGSSDLWWFRYHKTLDAYLGMSEAPPLYKNLCCTIG